MVDIFVTQFDGCQYLVNGKPSSGFNCTCATEAMWLYRASGGKTHTTSCRVREATGDRSNGTYLGQMEQVSIALGITTGRVYRPALWELPTSLVSAKRYGFHLNLSYRPLAGTRYDSFRNRFRGNHDVYVSGPGSTSGTWRVGDPGANGRYAGCPNGYQDIPVSLLKRAAGELDLGGHMLGFGKAYIYATPPDPSTSSPKYKATVIKATALWNDSTKKWVYNGANNIKVNTPLVVRGATYSKGGVVCYPVDASSPNYPGYYVPKANVKLGARV